MKFNEAIVILDSGRSVFRRGWRAGDYITMEQAGTKAKIAVLVSPKGQYKEPWLQKQEDVQSEDWEMWV